MQLLSVKTPTTSHSDSRRDHTQHLVKYKMIFFSSLLPKERISCTYTIQRVQHNIQKVLTTKISFTCPTTSCFICRSPRAKSKRTCKCRPTPDGSRNGMEKHDSFSDPSLYRQHRYLQHGFIQIHEVLATFVDV